MQMKTNEIRELTSDEIKKRLDDAREEIMRLRFRQATGELTDTSQIRLTRRTIARFVTILDGQNRVVSNPGGTSPVYQDGALQPIYQASSAFEHCHDVCVDSDENLYVCQWRAKQVYPYKLERLG